MRKLTEEEKNGWKAPSLGTNIPSKAPAGLGESAMDLRHEIHEGIPF